MRKTFLALSFAATALFGASTQAQTKACSKFAVSGTGKPGTTLTFNLTSPDKKAPALMFVGSRMGKFTMRIGPIGVLTLGIRRPFVPVMLGLTNDKGALEVKVPLPKGKFKAATLYAQATTMQIKFPPPRIKFCTSNVVKFKIGG